MANREENLKKINDELEQLSDEELDQVAGGGRVQTSWDSYFLKRIGYMDETYDTLIATWSSGSAAIDAGWRKAGIISKTWFTDYNEYYDAATGKQLSRKEAYALALKNRGYNDIAIHDFNYEKYGNFGGFGA